MAEALSIFTVASVLASLNVTALKVGTKPPAYTVAATTGVPTKLVPVGAVMVSVPALKAPAAASVITRLPSA